MKLIAMALILTSSSAFASRVVDLKRAEVQSANFLAQCANEISNKSYIVVSGLMGTFEQGILYSYTLKANDGSSATLEVRWTKSSRTYDCSLK